MLPARYNQKRRYFNPRTPCGVRLYHGDQWRGLKKFQSTHPVRGATLTKSCSLTLSTISIHAPRAGCDLYRWTYVKLANDFNPRTPCRVRQSCSSSQADHSSFQSTHPVQGATLHTQRFPHRFEISIHAPRAGCDAVHGLELLRHVISIHAPRAGCDPSWSMQPSQTRRYFNPRTPCRVRHHNCLNQSSDRLFQSTHPVQGATLHSTGMKRWTS